MHLLLVSLLVLMVFPARPTRYALPAMPLAVVALAPIVTSWIRAGIALTAGLRLLVGALGVLGGVILIAALVGVVSGAGLIWLMHREGMLAERSGAAILLAAIALFYPVFAAAEGDWLAFALPASPDVEQRKAENKAEHQRRHEPATGAERDIAKQVKEIAAI